MDLITIAKLVSVPTAFLLSGYGICASQSPLPLLFKQPASVSTPIFSGIYHRGAVVVIPGVIISAAASAYLAYSVPRQRTMYATASALTFGFLPFTITFVLKGVGRLLEISESAVAQQKGDASGEVLRLLKAWAFQNSLRAALTFTGGLVGMFAILTERA